jgi:hypothetical protein
MRRAQLGKRIGQIVLILLAVALPVVHVVFVPLRPGYLRVSITPRATQTNAAGQVEHVYAVRNGGLHEVVANAGTETKTGEKQFHYRFVPSQNVKPGEEILMATVAATPPARTVVICQKAFRPGWREAARSFLEITILKRGVVEYFYPEEMSGK